MIHEQENIEREDEDRLSSLIDTYKPDYDRSGICSEWRRQRDVALPLRLLYDNWHYILRVDQPHHIPDKGYVNKLKLISPDLSVHWIGRNQRWGLFINHRVYYTMFYRNIILTVQDIFPMNTEIIKGPRGEYQPLDERSLPEMDYSKINIFDYMTMMDAAYEENIKRQIKHEDELFQNHQKEHGRHSEKALCDLFGIKHIGITPVNIDLKNGGYNVSAN
jgi:hypothetical protein